MIQVSRMRLEGLICTQNCSCTRLSRQSLPKIINPLPHSPFPFACRAGEIFFLFLQRRVTACGTFEECNRIGGNPHCSRLSTLHSRLDKHTRRNLPQRAGPLEKRIHTSQDAHRRQPFEQAKAEVRDGQRFLDGKAHICQPAAHGLGVKVEVQLGELDRLEREWAPFLAAQSVAQDGLKILFVGVFQDEVRTGLKDVPHLAQGLGRIRHVVQRADHGRRVEQPVHEWQAIDVSRDENKPVRSAQACLRLLELGARIIQQDDALETGVARRVSPRTGAQFEQQFAAFREQTFQRDGFAAVLVFAPAAIPERGLVIGAVVVADWWSGHLVG